MWVTVLHRTIFRCPLSFKEFRCLSWSTRDSRGSCSMPIACTSICRTYTRMENRKAWISGGYTPPSSGYPEFKLPVQKEPLLYGCLTIHTRNSHQLLMGFSGLHACMQAGWSSILPPSGFGGSNGTQHVIDKRRHLLLTVLKNKDGVADSLTSGVRRVKDTRALRSK